MNKVLYIIFLFFFWNNFAFAEEVNKSMQQLLDEGYKITNEKLSTMERVSYKIFTFKKGKNIIICSIRFDNVNMDVYSRCVKP